MTTGTTGDPVTLDRLAKVYIKIRETLSQELRVWEEREAALKAQQAAVAAEMKDRLQALGAKSAGTAYGTVSLKTTTRYYFQDWEAADKFIIEQEAPFLLERRVSQSKMAEFLEKNPGVVPPGLNTMSELTVSVTKPRK
jgi:hypothetical protein